MIRTTNEIYNTRNNGVSRIYIEISEEVNDTDAEAFLFNVRDYIFEAGVKKTINTKPVIMSYAERDALKSQIVSELKMVGTESEINKQLMPLALLYITKADPLYNQTAADFELNI